MIQDACNKPVLDKEFFLTATAHDLGLRKYLIVTFLEEAEAMLQTLGQHEPTESVWRETAHQLKGSSINMGLLRLSALAALAEFNNPPETGDAYRGFLRKTLTESGQELKALL